MKKFYLSVLFVFHFVFIQAQVQQLPFIVNNDMSSVKVRNIEFTENKGQWNSSVLFRANLNEAVIYFEKDGMLFTLLDPVALEEFMKYKMKPKNECEKNSVISPFIDAHAYKVNFLNSNKAVRAEGKGKLPDYENYFIGNDPAQWASNVKKYTKILYNEIYEGIDLQVYEHQGVLKYDFIVRAGFFPGQIKLKYEGIDKIEIKSNDLVIHTSVNKVIELQPHAYQNIEGKQTDVKCNYSLNSNTVTFSFPESYDENYDLVIDPILVFASYSGSYADNWGYTATYDSKGFLYAGGSVFDIGYPITTGAFQPNYGGDSCDIAITKFDTTGALLIYSTYLGGSGSEVPHSLIVNSQDELFVYATTGSSNYPVTPNAYDTSFNGGTQYMLTTVINYINGSDIVISRFNSSGTDLLASTYFGGSGNDGLNMYAPLKHNYADDCRGEIMIDNNDNIYVASSTSSLDFPTTAGVFQLSYGGDSIDGCLFKMDNNLSTLIWSSYIGGSGSDAVYSISLDEDDNPIIAGGTTSDNFPVTSGVVGGTNNGGISDGFITRISQNGNSILHSTYWGTNVYDQVYFVDVDKNDFVYILGQTADSTSGLHQNALWFIPGGGQFISKLSYDLTNIEWSTVFGTGNGTVDISPTAFLIDYCNNVYMSGWGGPIINGFGGTLGLPVTSDAFQTTTDNNDYYFLVMADDASGLVYASFYGGTLSREHVDGGTSRFDKGGAIYQAICAGCGAGYDDFPTTPGAWSSTNNSSNCNMGVVKIDFGLPVIVANFSSTAPVCLPDSVVFNNTSILPNPSQTTCFWNFGDGNISYDCNPTHQYTNSGVYNVMLIVTDNGACNFFDTIFHQVLVLNDSIGTLPTKKICKDDFIQIGIPPYVGPNISYQWQPTSFLSNPNISNPIASPAETTDYLLIISDGVCTDSIFQKVVVYDFEAFAGNDTVSCSLNYTLIASVSGVNSDSVLYHWSSNNQFTDTLNNNPDENFAYIYIENSGMYYVMVYNDYCLDIDSIFVVTYDINANFTPVQPLLCYGDCNGSISSSPVGGIPPYEYLWSHNNETTAQISALCSGNYSVTITDSDGCEVVKPYNLLQPALLMLAPGSTNIPCEEACIAQAFSNASGGTQSYNYIWSNGQTTSTATNLCEGFYSVTVTDNNNCINTASTEVVVDWIYDNVNAWADKDTIYESQSTNIHATNIPGVDYIWTPTSGLQNPNYSSTQASPGTTTSYVVTLNDGNGCIYNDSVTIYVKDVFCEEPFIYIPNSFTPDGDGLNDVLYVRGIYIEEMELKIFNRWGELVFETKNQSVGWDGTRNSKLVDPDVYIFSLNIICYGEVLFSKKGNITVIR